MSTTFDSFLGSIFGVKNGDNHKAGIDGYRNGHSGRKGVDSKLRFSIDPLPGEDAFCQWKDAMRAVARLPMGIPGEFRKKVWLALADNYLNSMKIDWNKTKRFAFNERSNPDDNKLGLQIVKDLHRTGCSGFSGHDNEEERALLKRVLLAYARWNKQVGYCQGFNVLAALILDVVERKEGDALKVMIFLVDHVLPTSYFTNNLRALSVDMAVFRDLLDMHVPDLANHLDNLQKAARDDTTGTNYEPPLTNVFTMQWFLTLFATCIPETTALRVWDSVLLEGSEILLRTALAIWSKLKPRILDIDSADEFYSTMGVLTQEMLDCQIIDADELVKTIYTMAGFPFPQLVELREKYTYNITPFSAAMSTGGQRSRRSGKTSIFSDDDEMLDDEDLMMENIGCFTGMLSSGQTSPGRNKALSDSDRSSSSYDVSKVSPGAYGVTPQQLQLSSANSERMSLDLYALKQQYRKVRQRQKQAHIILTAANARHQANLQRDQKYHIVPKTVAPSIESPIAVNHLFLGRDMRKQMKNHNGKNRTIVEAPKIAYGNSIVPATFNTAAPQNRYKHSGYSSNRRLYSRSEVDESEEHCTLDDLPGIPGSGMERAQSMQSLDSEMSATSVVSRSESQRGLYDTGGSVSDVSTVCENSSDNNITTPQTENSSLFGGGGELDIENYKFCSENSSGNITTTQTDSDVDISNVPGHNSDENIVQIENSNKSDVSISIQTVNDDGSYIDNTHSDTLDSTSDDLQMTCIRKDTKGFVESEKATSCDLSGEKALDIDEEDRMSVESNQGDTSQGDNTASQLTCASQQGNGHGAIQDAESDSVSNNNSTDSSLSKTSDNKNANVIKTGQNEGISCSDGGGRPTLLQLSQKATGSHEITSDHSNDKNGKSAHIKQEAQISGIKENSGKVSSPNHHQHHHPTNSNNSSSLFSSNSNSNRRFVRHHHIHVNNPGNQSSPPYSDNDSETDISPQLSPVNHGNSKSKQSLMASAEPKVFNPFPSRHMSRRRAENGVKLGLYSAGQVPQVEVGMVRGGVARPIGRAQLSQCLHRQYMEEVRNNGRVNGKR